MASAGAREKESCSEIMAGDTVERSICFHLYGQTAENKGLFFLLLFRQGTVTILVDFENEGDTLWISLVFGGAGLCFFWR